MSGGMPTPSELRLMGADAAAALFVERLQRDNPGDVGQALRQWLADDASHRAAWVRAQEIWLLFEDDAAGDILSSLREQALSLDVRARRKPLIWSGLALAAAACAALVILMQPLQQLNPSKQLAANGLSRFGRPDFVTADRGVTAHLPDGTTVTLGRATTLDVAFGPSGRLARLGGGAARFNIGGGSSVPFRLAAGGRIITDVGTDFQVSVSGAAMRVDLTAGAIEVRDGSDPRTTGTGPVRRLRPGERLQTRARGPDQIVPRSAASVRAQALLQFSRTPLSQAVARMNATGRPRLTISDPTIAGLEISGVFRSGDSARFAQTLAALYPIAVRTGPDGTIVLKRRR